MERQLHAPILITSIDEPKYFNTKQAYHTILATAPTVPLGTARTQLERLADSLGVDCGEIQASEEEEREQRRKEVRMAAKAERRRLREEEKRLQEQEDLEDQIEHLGDAEQPDQARRDDGEMENGGAEFEGEDGMEDRGDVEYGDVVNDEDDDEPDNEDEDQGQMEVDEW